MFETMIELGMALSFIDMVRLLFASVKTTICFNGTITKTFPIYYGVRQGCPFPHICFSLLVKSCHTQGG